MARVETVLSVFLASPGDVADARKRLEKVVDELNYIWSRQYRLRIELVKWETHAYSDIGIDAQDVINRQLNEFDIFLGIMWKRFGEPTGRAESGTQEEFMRARQRHAEDPEAVRIMFYFKDAAPERLSNVDAEQLEAVNRFRKEVADSGVLYWTYKTTSEFESIVRQHLSRQVQEWGKTWGGVVEDSTRPPISATATDEAGKPAVIPEDEPQARSVTAIVFEEVGRVERLRQRSAHDPEVIHRSFIEAQAVLDSSPNADDWGHLAAQQATALVAVALAGRFEEGKAAQALVIRVCERIMNLRGLRINWGDEGKESLYKLSVEAKFRQDDEVLWWLKRQAVE